MSKETTFDRTTTIGIDRLTSSSFKLALRLALSKNLQSNDPYDSIGHCQNSQ
jgi:hypothetical protein